MHYTVHISGLILGICIKRFQVTLSANHEFDTVVNVIATKSLAADVYRTDLDSL